MSRCSTLAVLSAAIIVAAVTTTSTTTLVMASPPAPADERFYTTDAECGLDSTIGDPSISFPCFSCFNIPSDPAPTTITTKAPTIITDAPTASPSTNPFPVKSIYTHCFLDKESVYTLYYIDADCQGSILLEEIRDNTCPDCTGCSSYGDCGRSPTCSTECCGISPECVRCQNAGACAIYSEECEGCPGCSNPNPFCDLGCTNSKLCDLYGAVCTGCSGCSNPPDPCESCVNVIYCGYPYVDEYCNKGNCDICAGVDPCSNCVYESLCNSNPEYCNNGTCAICQGSEYNHKLDEPEGRLLEDIEKLKVRPLPKFEMPTTQYYRNGRLLESDSSNNFTSYARAGSAVQDDSYEFVFGSLFISAACSEESLVGSFPFREYECQEIPPEADNQTLALVANCDYGLSATAFVTGYSSLKSCKDGIYEDVTFSLDASEGVCIAAPTDKWGVSIQCTGWGKVPPAPTPPTPGSNDITFGARLRYPDRRCVPGTGQVVEGEIAPCDKCIALPNQSYAKVNCTSGEMNAYTQSNCTGEATAVPLEKCDGLGPLRGIFNFEKIFKPVNKVGFVSIHVGLDGCWAENVELFGGVETDVCAEIKPPKGFQDGMPYYARVNCTTRSVEVFEEKGCSGDIAFSSAFTDNACIPIPDSPAFIRASCNSYQTPLPAPPTKSPTLPTKSPTPTAPTVPTTPTTPSPTDTTKSSAMSNVQVSYVAQVLVAGLVAVVVNQ